MENRLKERLTGAAILVALVVLVVPELFRGGAGAGQHNAHLTPAANTAASIEAPAAAASSTAASLASPAVPEAAHAPAGSAEHSFTFSLAAPPAPSGASNASGASDASSASVVSSASGGPGISAESGASGAGASVTRQLARVNSPEKAGASASEDASRQAAVPAPPAVAAPTAHASPRQARALRTGWTVQLGVFADSANARRLLRKARGRGFHAELDRFGTRRLYRVAIPGLPDRAHAEQLRQRLHAQGFAAAVMR